MKYYDKEQLIKLDSNNKKNIYFNKIQSLEKQKKEIENEINKTRNYLKSLYEDKVNGIITTNQFKDLILNYNKNEEKFNKEIKNINDDINYYKIKEKNKINKDKIFNKYKKINKLNKIIIDEFINKIYIGKINNETNTRDIKIKWNF